jgi:hypothetical protein
MVQIVEGESSGCCEGDEDLNPLHHCTTRSLMVQMVQEVKKVYHSVVVEKSSENPAPFALLRRFLVQGVLKVHLVPELLYVYYSYRTSREVVHFCTYLHRHRSEWSGSAGSCRANPRLMSSRGAASTATGSVLRRGRISFSRYEVPSLRVRRVLSGAV